MEVLSFQKVGYTDIEVFSFKGVGIGEVPVSFHELNRIGSTAYRGAHISGGWNREVPLYTHFRGLEWRGSAVYIGALISGG